MSGEWRHPRPIPRRDFLGTVASATCGAALGLAGVGILRLPYPGVVPEEASEVKVGPPEDIAEGSPVWVKSAKAFVFRQGRELYCISAVCPHLGCIVQATAEGFDCPCHGSRFDGLGRVKSGPAPTGLPWLALAIGPAGAVVIDTRRPVQPGTRLRV